MKLPKAPPPADLTRISPSSPRLRTALRGCSPIDAARPAGQLLSRIPWERRAADPQRLTAEQFLSRVTG